MSPLLEGGLDHRGGGVSTYLGAPACENPKQKEGMVEWLGSAEGGDSLAVVWSFTARQDSTTGRGFGWERGEIRRQDYHLQIRLEPVELERGCY